VNPHADFSPTTLTAIDRAGLSTIREKLDAGVRLDFDDGMRLFTTPETAALAALANRERERRWGDLTFFNRNVHVNATNVCEASCIFCSFARLKTGDPDSYTMSLDQALSRIRALKDELITEVHIVNGLNPDLPWSYYTDLLRAIKQERPDLHLKCFTAVEIAYFSEKYGKSVRQVLEELVEAGLGSLPGGGAEIFHPRARKKLCADKVSAEGWLDVHRTAHRMGLRSNCTMLFGSIEKLDERVDHLLRLRDLQDETGGFQTFIPLRFHNENNRLQRLKDPTGYDCLRTYAVSRLMLDNIDHIKAYWIMLGMKLAQVSLDWGVDDIDGTVREERIYHMAGAKTPQELTRAELVNLIRLAGRVPVERDTLYNIVAEA
jgi:aminodeoxyfutalosine synthase